MRFLSIVFYLLSSLLYYDYTNTHLSPSGFVGSLTPGGVISGSIYYKDSSQWITKKPINGGGKFFYLWLQLGAQ